ncbi:MAG: M28 family peptidase [Bacilli bacterium]|nr:M28 family peptidase [Bacilli bacterium]
MKNYLQLLIEKFPIRRSKDQKEQFRAFIKNEVNNYDVVIENLENKHNNIIIGNVAKAKVVFTAHYDTPAASLYPNLMLPKNFVLSLLYGIFFPILMALISLALAYGLYSLMRFPYETILLLYIVIYFGMFYLLTRCFPNKNNSNDNTSGVSVILTLIEKNYQDVAFILFDNEEKGLLGSKAYKKAHKEMMSKKVLINFDCVGNGKHIIITSKKEARTTELYTVLTNCFTSDLEYSVEFVPMEKSRSNTDHKNYELGIGILACIKTKKGFCYTPRIHTKKDIKVDFNNILFITNNLSKLIENYKTR